MSMEVNSIQTNWEEFMKIELGALINLSQTLITKGQFTHEEHSHLFSDDDDNHKKRMFLFRLSEKQNVVANTVVRWLGDNGYNALANAVHSGLKHCVSFMPSSHLIIDVKKSDTFRDSHEWSPNVAYYYSRSKKRGRVLIINNYQFPDSKLRLDERRGAQVDSDNLCSLFTKLGGWEIVLHENKTKMEMDAILADFAKYHADKVCDICMVFIMSHGTEISKDIVVYGSDSRDLRTSDVDKYFLPSNCKLFLGKPKIFIYQVCRGPNLGTYIDNSTEMDSNFTAPLTNTAVVTRYRVIEDMMYGFASQSGFQAYRDIFRGTWYVELICQQFMNLAHCEPVDHLLMKVDEGLRIRQSERCHVQTSEIVNLGFKKLFLNPGIYEENNQLKRYQSD
ncbi:caspase-7-like [Rhynchophorus ferrugineus]|uniref:Uncharacterized protein n=1 Tax=Rhynchophorus ferrugineus TaxID=354439 RepID=A0A834MEM6_RHYFE|nr:hypothetical protein GWI33_005397 [Rhynchophorus ferrugineus]